MRGEDGCEERQEEQDNLELQLKPCWWWSGYEVQATQGNSQGGDKRQTSLCRGCLSTTGGDIYYSESPDITRVSDPVYQKITRGQHHHVSCWHITTTLGPINIINN